MKNEKLADWTEYLQVTKESMLLADGFEDAFVGVSLDWGPPKAVYFYDKCVDILIERDKMSYEAAVEFIEYNVVAAYVGKQTPLFIRETP